MVVRASIPLRIRWSDLDSYGHVNNVAALDLIQEARTRFLQQSDWHGNPDSAQGGALVIVAHQEAEYVAQIAYRTNTLAVDVWVSKVGGANLDLGFEIWDEAHEQLYVRASNVIVFVPREGVVPRRLTDIERSVGRKYLEPAPQFRHGR